MRRDDEPPPLGWPRTSVDLADVRPCFFCGTEVLHVTCCDSGVIQLDPQVVLDGRTVAHGWALRGRHWCMHIGSLAGPNDCAFRSHTECVPIKRGRQQVTPQDPFGTAGAPGASGPPQEELLGRLLLIDVKAIERGIQTTAGVSDAARADVVCLDDGTTFGDSLLWGKVLVGQLTPGVKYVGRLGKGEASPGKNAPWVWEDGTADDKAVAVRYLTHAASQSVGTTATAAAPAEPVTPPSAPAPKPPWA